MQTIETGEVSLYELESRFQLEAIDREFVEALLVGATEITAEEQKTLDRIRHNYQSLLRYGNLSEESVKMVVLSYLLDLYYTVSINVFSALLKMNNPIMNTTKLTISPYIIIP